MKARKTCEINICEGENYIEKGHILDEIDDAILMMCRSSYILSGFLSLSFDELANGKFNESAIV